MNSPHLTFFAKLTQHWRKKVENVLNLTLWFQSCIKVVTTESMIYCRVHFLSKVDMMLKHYKFDIAVSTLRKCEFTGIA